MVDAFNVVSLTLPGVAVTYQGEEIGMVNNMDISYEETVDPRGCNCGPDEYLKPSCSRCHGHRIFYFSVEKQISFIKQ